MNLILENVSDDLAKAIEAMAKIANTKVKLKKKLTINGFTPEFEKKTVKKLNKVEKVKKYIIFLVTF
ncbi:hypothetical protein FSM15_01645 [Campylobacter jejuni]|nr:hypothetical protein [Campylobacter jejuni]ECL2360254.1 hypothetical protein [Campylobacter jejuni]HED7247491.1 hypothetical protein [Campylobacter jejuni]HEG6280036.1 hypothetical protein [Campylobacter jejuni]